MIKGEKVLSHMIAKLSFLKIVVAKFDKWLENDDKIIMKIIRNIEFFQSKFQ